MLLGAGSLKSKRASALKPFCHAAARKALCEACGSVQYDTASGPSPPRYSVSPLSFFSDRLNSGNRSSYPQPLLPSSFQRSKHRRWPRMNTIALIALEPPIALPRGNAMRRFCKPGSGSVAYPQSSFDPTSVTQRPGVVTAGSLLVGPPASSSNTRTDLSALRRLATTQPEEPAPTTM